MSKRLQAARKIRDYPYVMHVLDKSLSYEEVAEIFVRVNSLGIKLRGSDLALAQITSRWPGSLKLFEDFQEECEEKWFTLDLGLLVRALVVFATRQSRFKTVGGIPLQTLKNGWEAAKDGIRYSVNFLSANAGLEDESLLSSPMLLIVPGFYAWTKNFEIGSEEERELKQGLFYANARGHYSGASESTLDTDLNIISKGGASSELIASLRTELGRLETRPEDFEGRGKRNALFPTAYLALRAAGAKDWRTGLALALTHQGRLHFVEHHHIFPKALLKKAGYSTADINQIANLAFIAGGTNRSLFTRPPEEYLPEIIEKRGEQALQAHCVPLDPQLWRLDAFPKFVEARRVALAGAINEFIEGVEKSDFPDLASLLASGEGQIVEFKASARWDYRESKHNKVLELIIAKTIAGFLNTDSGGTLVLGTGDDGKVLGLESDYKTLHQRPDRDGYQQFLVNLVSTTMGRLACSSVRIEFVTWNGVDICVVRCAPSPRPVYVQEAQQSKFYLRTGNATQELNTKDSVDYITWRWR